jgi:hypothetical protein
MSIIHKEFKYGAGKLYLYGVARENNAEHSYNIAVNGYFELEGRRQEIDEFIGDLSSAVFDNGQLYIVYHRPRHSQIRIMSFLSARETVVDIPQVSAPVVRAFGRLLVLGDKKTGHIYTYFDRNVFAYRRIMDIAADPGFIAINVDIQKETFALQYPDKSVIYQHYTSCCSHNWRRI